MMSTKRRVETEETEPELRIYAKIGNMSINVIKTFRRIVYKQGSQCHSLALLFYYEWNSTFYRKCCSLARLTLHTTQLNMHVLSISANSQLYFQLFE